MEDSSGQALAQLPAVCLEARQGGMQTGGLGHVLAVLTVAQHEGRILRKVCDSLGRVPSKAGSRGVAMQRGPDL